MAKSKKETKVDALPAPVRAALSDFARDSYIEQIAEEIVFLVVRLSVRPSEPWIRNIPVVDYLTTKLMRERGPEGDNLLAELQWRMLEVVDEWSKEHMKAPSPALVAKLEEAFEQLQAGVDERTEA